MSRPSNYYENVIFFVAKMCGTTLYLPHGKVSYKLLCSSYFSGTDPNRPIHVVHLNAYPLPIKAPGKVHLSMIFNVTRDLPETIAMDVSLSKYLYNIPVKIPCVKDFGTW